jgi:hypothetical protein
LVWGRRGRESFRKRSEFYKTYFVSATDLYCRSAQAARNVASCACVPYACKSYVQPKPEKKLAVTLSVTLYFPLLLLLLSSFLLSPPPRSLAVPSRVLEGGLVVVEGLGGLVRHAGRAARRVASVWLRVVSLLPVPPDHRRGGRVGVVRVEPVVAAAAGRRRHPRARRRASRTAAAHVLPAAAAAHERVRRPLRGISRLDPQRRLAVLVFEIRVARVPARRVLPLAVVPPRVRVVDQVAPQRSGTSLPV